MMNDLPPRQEKLVLIHDYKAEHLVNVKAEVWQEMETQMQLTGLTLTAFVTKALEFFITDLKIEQDNEKIYLDCSEYQLFPSSPVPIRPNPMWAYHIDENEGE